MRFSFRIVCQQPTCSIDDCTLRRKLPISIFKLCTKISDRQSFCPRGFVCARNERCGCLVSAYRRSGFKRQDGRALLRFSVQDLKKFAVAAGFSHFDKRSKKQAFIIKLKEIHERFSHKVNIFSRNSASERSFCSVLEQFSNRLMDKTTNELQLPRENNFNWSLMLKEDKPGNEKQKKNREKQQQNCLCSK